MLQNAYFLAKIGADTAENEQHFAEILPTDALWRLRELSLAARRRPAGTSWREAASRQRRGQRETLTVVENDWVGLLF